MAEEMFDACSMLGGGLGCTAPPQMNKHQSLLGGGGGGGGEYAGLPCGRVNRIKPDPRSSQNQAFMFGPASTARLLPRR